jgi:hypothetical protein
MELSRSWNGARSASELYLNSISCPTTTFRQPQAFPYSRPPAPPTTTPPPHNEAFLFVQCSLSPTSTLESYTTTMSSTNLHNTKMIFLIVRSLRLYFYAIAAPAGWIRQHYMPNLTIALTKPRLKISSILEDITAHTEFQSVIFFWLCR